MLKIAEFHGIVIYMNYYDVHPHHLPHIHAQYQDEEVSLSIPDGKVLAGALPRKQLRLLQKWVADHKDELVKNWKLAVGGKNTFEIEPL